jgi:hypothetical protein
MRVDHVEHGGGVEDSVDVEVSRTGTGNVCGHLERASCAEYAVDQNVPSKQTEVYREKVKS